MMSILSWLFFALLLLPFSLQAQPKNDQNWNAPATLSGDAFTVNCSEFVIPSDVGRLINAQMSVTSDSDEMSQTMRSAHAIRVPLLPESGTSDTLSNINGCGIDTAWLMLTLSNPAHTITIDGAGNIIMPAGVSTVVLNDPGQMVLLTQRFGDWYFIGGVSAPTGGGGGSKINTDATSEAASYQWGDGTSRIKIWCESSVCYIKCEESVGVDCPSQFVVATGQTHRIADESLLNYVEWADDLTTTLVGSARLPGVFRLTPSGLVGDGAECDQDPTFSFPSGEPKGGLECPMAGAVDGNIYSYTPLILPANFDKTADLVPVVRAYLVFDAASNLTLQGVIRISCDAPGESPGSNYITGVNLDLSITTGDSVGDILVGTGSTLDTDTTGADCDPGDHLSVHFKVCDTGSGSAGCTSSAGAENDVAFFSLEFNYLKNSFSE